MAEGTYEYECMRAELLGLAKPNKEEFLAQQKEKIAHQEEEVEENTLNELGNQEDSINNVSGGLDEINHILSKTQQKLNRFKSACGSLTNLLKIKVGHGDSTESISSKEVADGEKNEGEKEEDGTGSEKMEKEQDKEQEPTATAAIQNGTPRKTDLAKALDNHVDKIDSLICKAEKAQYSMAHQTKQIKSFLK